MIICLMRVIYDLKIKKYKRMKKVIIILSLFLLNQMVYAQLDFSQLGTDAIEYTSVAHAIGEDGFIIFHDDSYGIFNKSLKMTVKVPLNFDKGTKFISVCEGVDGGVVAIYRTYNKKEDAHTYQKVLINTDGTIKSTENLASLSEAKREDNLSRSITSPDGKLHGHFIFTLDKSNKLKELIILTLNNDGDIVDTRNFTPQFNYEFIAFRKAILTNDGTFYFALTSRQKFQRKGDMKESIHIIRVNESEVAIYDFEEFDFGYIATVSMIPLENGDLFIGGFYSEVLKKNKNLPGRFALLFDTESEYFFNMKSEKLSKYEKPITLDVNVLDIREMENTVLMIGEEKVLVHRHINGGTYYEWHTQDIVVAPFAKNAGLMPETYITKRLKSPGWQFFVNADVVKVGNTLGIISNGSYKKHLSGKGEKMVNVVGAHQEIGTIAYLVSEEGKVKEKILEAPNAEKTAFIRVLYSDDSQAVLLYGRSKSAPFTPTYIGGFEFKLRRVTF